MLKRLDNVSSHWERSIGDVLFGNAKLYVVMGRRKIRVGSKFKKNTVVEMKARSATEPVRYVRLGRQTVWRYAGDWYGESEGLCSADVQALVTQRDLRKRRTLQLAHAEASAGRLPDSRGRSPLPSDVRQLVWERDGGQCQACGATTELQFDHIIPLSMGGSDVSDNLQVLCGPCNRRKGTAIG